MLVVSSESQNHFVVILVGDGQSLEVKHGKCNDRRQPYGEEGPYGAALLEGCRGAILRLTTAQSVEGLYRLLIHAVQFCSRFSSKTA
jgi:hypothetical protein